MRALVTATTALATVAGLAVLVCTGSWRCALRVLLDLLTAAGLLRRLLWAALAAATPARLSAASSGQEDHHLPLAVGGETGESGRTAT